ncbi:hypothetical protein KKC97_14085 [bacterium]|nr:hypothetical protein [bacterium]MBU1638788.1 hypothetical protein [bacterium]MBU1921149.1 hypothetical protein [bacterium]
MPKRFFLFGIDSETSNIPVIANPGLWKSDTQGQDFISTYASEIVIERQQSDPLLLTSQPSVFARPLQFASAFANKDHPLHQSVVSEWRGLLGIFALQGRTNVQVTATLFVVPPLRAKASKVTDTQLPAEHEENILSILREQLPFPAEEWRQFWLLRCKDELVGATSPMTIVYTPTYPCHPKRIPWRNENGRLYDPIDYYKPPQGKRSPDLSVLHHWIDRLLRAENRNWLAGIDEQWEALILERLKEWREDLEAFIDPSLTIDLGSPVPLISKTPYASFVFRSSEVILKRDGEEVSVPSDLFRRDRSGQAFIMLTHSQKLPPKLRVYGPVLSDQINPNLLSGPRGDAGWETPEGRKIPLPYVIADEHFLPRQLLRLRASNTAMLRGVSDYALPLTPAILDFYSYDELAEHPEWISLHEDERNVYVRLDLPLSGHRLTIEKSYSIDRSVIEVTKTPLLGMWPDFNDPDWYANYAVLVDEEEAGTVFAPILYTGRVLNSNSAKSREEKLRIWQSQEQIIGFAVFGADQEREEYTNAGIILRASLGEQVKTLHDNKWTVGLDFGTSNTIVKYLNGGKPQELPLENRIAKLTLAAEDYAKHLFREFYPYEGTIYPPFATLLTKVRTSDFSSVQQAALSSADDRSRSARYWDQPEDIADVAKENRLIDNLKWGGGGAKRDDEIRSYLRSIVEYIIAEARANGVSDLEFRWAYPLSLPENSKTAISSFWQSVSQNLVNPNALRISVAKSMSESEATACCLSRKAAAALKMKASDVLSVSIDIGGGSSDAGFWLQEELLDTVSFKLAGNDIPRPVLDESHLAFIDSVRDSFFDEFIDKAAPQLVRDEVQKQDLKNAVEGHWDIAWNLMMRRIATIKGVDTRIEPNLHPVVRALGQVIGREEHPWVMIRDRAFLLFSGLTYYLGLHVAHIMKDKLPGEVNLYWAGLGSSYLSWIAPPAQLAAALRQAFIWGLKKVSRSAANKDVIVNCLGQVFNRPGANPIPVKDEVVIGLLSANDKSRIKVDRSIIKKVLVGEIGWTDENGEVDWTRESDAKEIAELAPPTDMNGTFIDGFLHSYLPHCTEGLNLNEKLLYNIVVNGPDVQNAIRESFDEYGGILQPVFASELLVAMDKLALMSLDEIH